MNNYVEMVKTAVNEGIDLIISGAGLPTKLPELVKGSKVKIAPIVSSRKAAAIITKYWTRNYNRLPDLIILEGKKAGGHLGFKEEALLNPNKPSLASIVQEVIEVLKPYCEKFNRKIPVIAAGGIFTGADIAKQLKAGAAGVQMATRFVATEECDANIAYKKAYIEAREDDILIINSPVGLPGRALNNPFIKRISSAGEKILKCSHCLQGCNPLRAPYCISRALINAVKGNLEKGLIFVGSNAYRIKEMTTVSKLIEELVNEAKEALFK